MNALPDGALEEKLRNGLGSPPAADFDSWRRRHNDAIAYLNPVVTAAYHRRRRFFVRIASAAAVAAVIASVATWVFVPQQPTFAQTVNTINRAEAITWTITWYNRMVSQDGKRTWLDKAPRWERLYLAPNRYRDVRYDKDGNIARVDIEDTGAGRVLHLDMKKKTAMLEHEPSFQFGPGGNPFAGIAKVLEREPIEYVGQREVQSVTVNVFRYRKEFSQGGHEINDIWLDARTKRLVGYCTTPEDDPFDATTDPDRDNLPEPRFSKGTIAGVIHDEIVFDAQLDPKLFSLSPPEGFKIVESKARPEITEELLIEWLRVSARANRNMFVDSDPKALREWHTAIYEKAKPDRSETERQFLALAQKHANDGNFAPMDKFAEDFTKPRSFRYLGKGVKLGDSSRIVCFYQLKSKGSFRAVYGDLKVKDVQPDELPLPVEK